MYVKSRMVYPKWDFFEGLCHLFLTKNPENQALFPGKVALLGVCPLPSLMNFRPPAIWQPCFAPAARWHSSKRSSRLRKSYKVGNVRSGNGENIWQLGVLHFGLFFLSPCIGSMGIWYNLPTWMAKMYGFHVGKYSVRPVDPMGRKGWGYESMVRG